MVEAGQIDGAAALYRQMIDILPTDAKSHYNLATMLKRRGDLDGAMRHYQEAVRSRPQLCPGPVQRGGNHRTEGVGQRGPVPVSSRPPDQPGLRSCTQQPGKCSWPCIPDPGIRNVPEAVQLAEKGCKLTNYRDPILLDTLGAAYAASGRYAEARKIAAQGLELATAGGNKPLADRIRRRIETYPSR